MSGQMIYIYTATVKVTVKNDSVYRTPFIFWIKWTIWVIKTHNDATSVDFTFKRDKSEQNVNFTEQKIIYVTNKIFMK